MPAARPRSHDRPAFHLGARVGRAIAAAAAVVAVLVIAPSAWPATPRPVDGVAQSGDVVGLTVRSVPARPWLKLLPSRFQTGSRAAARVLVDSGEPRVMMISRALVAPGERAAKRLQRAVARLLATRAGRADARALRIPAGALADAVRVSWREGRLVGQLVYLGPGGDFGSSLRASVVRALRARVKRINARTVWLALVDRVAAHGGRVGVHTALQAFSMAIRPLPGVRVPRRPVGRIPSGTLAVRWVLGNYDRLSRKQRAAVSRAISGRNRGASARAAARPGDAAIIAAARGYFSQEGKLGILDPPKISGPRAPHPDDPKTGAPAYVVAYDANHSWKTWDRVASCEIVFRPPADGLRDAERRELLGHEVFHCLQADIKGSPQAFFSPFFAWVDEGSAQWAACDFAPASEGRKSYGLYLASPADDLFMRDYDAFGFYTLMQSVRIDPYERMAAMLLASTHESAYQSAVAGAEGPLLDRWASTYFRDATRGADWDAYGRCKPPKDRPAVRSVVVLNGKTVGLAVLRYAVGAFTLVSDADVTHLRVYDGTVRISGRGIDQRGVTSGFYATSERECPPGQVYEGPPLTPLVKRPTPYVAVTGGTGGAALDFEGIPLERFCRPEKPPEEPPLPPPLLPPAPAPLPSEGKCAGFAVTIVGTDGPDQLTGTDGHDVIDARGGDDRVEGLAGADVICGGDGADEISGGPAPDIPTLTPTDDIIFGGPGDDLLSGESGNDRLEGQEGDDRLDGGTGHDLLRAGDGVDFLFGRDGRDLLHGDDGNDTLDGADDADGLNGGAGNDVIDAGADGDSAHGGPGTDEVYGQDGNDILVGDDDNDRLVGGAGIDSINGEAGDDSLDGVDGSPHDSLTGGPGTDSCAGDQGDSIEECE